MARQARISLAHEPHLVAQRGHGLAPVFHDSEDAARYIADLREACRQHQVLLHAYALTKGQALLLLTPSTDSALGRAMQTLGRRYVAWWEVRNYRMVASIRQAAGDHPGGRVLAIVGSSHKPYFERYLAQSHDGALVDVLDLLR